ncbi:MAG: hypothetical protein K0R54_770 [Clostridiaceae bacterium]|jgi:hypothetical protein|nr:hypothetical protein [Clostridiaceae bacterium]
MTGVASALANGTVSVHIGNSDKDSENRDRIISAEEFNNEFEITSMTDHCERFSFDKDFIVTISFEELYTIHADKFGEIFTFDFDGHDGYWVNFDNEEELDIEVESFNSDSEVAMNVLSKYFGETVADIVVGLEGDKVPTPVVYVKFDGKFEDIEAEVE